MLCFLVNRDSYGVEIRNVIFELTDGNLYLGEGNLYPSLHKLEKGGFVKSYMSDISLDVRGGNRRKMYTITLQGRDFIDGEDEFRQRLKNWD